VARRPLATLNNPKQHKTTLAHKNFSSAIPLSHPGGERAEMSVTTTAPSAANAAVPKGLAFASDTGTAPQSRYGPTVHAITFNPCATTRLRRTGILPVYDRLKAPRRPPTPGRKKSFGQQVIKGCPHRNTDRRPHTRALPATSVA
jgi:hypothetical protein